jgi:predicted SAM-dependent methyltransferase
MKLHIGGKQAHPDWKILDVLERPEVDFIGIASNLEQFQDNSIEAIYASHVLEHFNHGWNNELLNTLNEWYRVLQPGGNLYLSVPDLKVICELFLHPNLMPMDKLYLMKVMFGGQVDEYDVHKVGFDADILALYLDKVGFSDYEQVTQFNLFNDCSTIKVLGRYISLNIIATKDSSEEIKTYKKHLKQYFSNIMFSRLPLFKSAKQTDWENPTTPIELNNFAVVNIIEAENTDGTSLRQFYLDLAIEALETALSLENNPLCVAHLGIIKNLLGENNIDYNIYYSYL